MGNVSGPSLPDFMRYSLAELPQFDFYELGVPFEADFDAGAPRKPGHPHWH